MSVSERSVTCSFFQELYSLINKNSGEKFENMFLVKIANKFFFEDVEKSGTKEPQTPHP